MPIDKIRLKISTPTEPNRLSRGFYQLEEDALFVSIGNFQKKGLFFSYIDSEPVKLEIDRNGHLIFIEVTTPRRFWTVNHNLSLPLSEQTRQRRAKFLDFRKIITTPKLSTTPQRDCLKINFAELEDCSCYQIADIVFIEVNPEGLLASIWISEIQEDFAGREMSEFRKKSGRREK